MKKLGLHILLELCDCECGSDFLDDRKKIEILVEHSAHRANTTVLKTFSSRFEPQGVTAVVILAESHISIHTWPEHKYAAADIFTCGDRAIPEKAQRFIVETLKPKRFECQKIDRGF